MAQYNTGTVSVTNASATVIGSGTTWLSEIEAGDLFIVVGKRIVYQVATVDSDTQITLTTPYADATASGVDYTIHRDFTTNANLPIVQQGDIETALVLREAMERLDTLMASLNALSVPVPVAEGGTGRQTATDKAIILGRGVNAHASMPVLVKGDLIAGQSAGHDPQVLSVGTNGSFLIADSSATLGVKWGNNPSLVSIDGVSNPGGNVDLVASGAIEITPDDASNQIIITETHSNRTDNPHGVTKVQVGLSNLTNDAQLKIASNLADLENVTTARTNLGLGSMALQSSSAVAITGGTAALTSVSTDTISEKTTNAGVTVDGVLLKDNAVTANVVNVTTLNVLGTVNAVNATEVDLGDNIIVLNAGEAGTPSMDAGITIERGTEANVSFLWNETSDQWDADAQLLGNIADPTAGSHVGDRDYNDARYLQKTNNLSDVADPATARGNIGAAPATHTSDTNNPHGVTAAQVGALVSLDGVSNPGGNIDLVPGAGITITSDDAANSITIATTAEANDGTNLGSTGQSVYAGKSGTTLQFRKITAGTNVTLSIVDDEIQVAAEGVPDGASFRVSSNDSTSGYAVDKLTAGIGLTISEIDDAGDETLQFTLAPSGVTAGQYGSSSAVPVVTVDETGRVTAISTASLGTMASQNSNAVSISGGTISGTNITVGAGKTLDVSNGTLTLADNQIAIAKVSGLQEKVTEVADTRYLRLDGTGAMSGALNCNGNRITNLADATADGDAMSRGAADARYGQIQQVVATYDVTETTTSGAFLNTGLSATITPQFNDSVIEAWAIVPAAQVTHVSGAPQERRGYFRIYNSTDGVGGPQSAMGHRLPGGSDKTEAASASVVMFMRYAVDSTAPRTFTVQMRVQEVGSTQISTSAAAAEMTLILREMRG